MDAPVRRLMTLAPLSAALLTGCGLFANEADERVQDTLRRSPEVRRSERAESVVRAQGPAPAAPLKPTAPAPSAATETPKAAPIVPAAEVTGAAIVPVEARAATDAKTSLKVVATVGPDVIITEDEVLMNLRQRAREYITLKGDERAAKERQVYREELRKLIDRELVLADFIGKIKKNKPQLVDEIWEQAGRAADGQIREIRNAMNIKTDADFTDALHQQGMNYKAFHRQMQRQTMVNMFMNTMLKDRGKTVGLVQIQDYYDRHPDEFSVPDQVKWLDLYVSTGRFASVAEAKQTADRLQAEAARGADFVGLVSKHGHGDSPLRNGVGIGEKKGSIQPVELEATLFALKPGQVSEVVAVENGYHVVKVLERQQAGLKPLDEKVQLDVKSKLIDRAVRAERDKLVADLRRRITVTVLEE